jgi:anti-sigma factor RsiW
MEPEEQSDDILLFAYVDGELTEDQRHRVEELLDHDPAARQRVEEIRELNKLLKAAYSEDSDEPT